MIPTWSLLVESLHTLVIPVLARSSRLLHCEFTDAWGFGGFQIRPREPKMPLLV